MQFLEREKFPYSSILILIENIRALNLEIYNRGGKNDKMAYYGSAKASLLLKKLA